MTPPEPPLRAPSAPGSKRRVAIRETRRTRWCRALLLPLLVALLAACSDPSQTPAGAPPELTGHLTSLGFGSQKIHAVGPERWAGTATTADGRAFDVTASARSGMLHFEVRSAVSATTTDSSGTQVTSRSASVMTGSFPHHD